MNPSTPDPQTPDPQAPVSQAAGSSIPGPPVPDPQSSDPQPFDPQPPDPQASDPLAPDCARCAALCCLALALDRGPAFAIDKPAGLPCPNLSGHACSIHARLAPRGFAGCARYSCQGAGQIVTQALFAGQSWRDRPELAGPMIAAFATLREVQEMRAQIAAARRLGLDAGVGPQSAALDALLAPDWTPAVFRSLDLAALRREFSRWLAALRSAAPGRPAPSPSVPPPSVPRPRSRPPGSA